MKKENKQSVKGTVQTYALGDFLIRVKNAAMAKNRDVQIISSKYVEAVANALKKMGFLAEVKKEGSVLTVSLAFKDKKPMIMDLRVISKPGLRIYQTVWDLEKKKGPSTYLISTPKGLISLREALKLRQGGEIIAEIW